MNLADLDEPCANQRGNAVHIRNGDEDETRANEKQTKMEERVMISGERWEQGDGKRGEEEMKGPSGWLNGPL